MTSGRRADGNGEPEDLFVTDIALDATPFGAAPPQALPVEAAPEVTDGVEIELA